MKMQENQRPISGISSTLGSNAPLRCASVLAAAISACYVPTVSAQGGGMMLEEIVVTVRRRVEMEQDVPISMKAMDSEFLREQNITELNDLGTTVPNVRISTAGTETSNPIVTIRGQRPSTVSLSLDQAAPLYFNEVVITPGTGSNLALYDMQSVQVLKGPQGTLFGRNSTGGAILATPARPGVELGGYAQVEVGNYNLWGFEGAVDIPASDAVQFRLAGKKVERDGYQDNVADNYLGGDETFWDDNSESARLTMNLITGGLTNIAVAAYDTNSFRGRVPVPVAFNPDSGFGQRVQTIFNEGNGYPVGAVDAAIAAARSRDGNEIETNIDGNEKVESTFFSNTTEYELTDNLSLKNVFGYRKVSFSTANDADGTYLNIFGAHGTEFSADGVLVNPIETGMNAEQFSNEFQLVGDAFDYSLEWIAGAYWYKMNGTQREAANAVVGINPNRIPGFDPIADAFAAGLVQASPSGNVTNEALGLFGEGTYSFNEQWSWTLGLRYSYDEREVTVKNKAGLGTPTCVVFAEGASTPLPDSACKRTVSEEFEAPTWRSSVNFTPIDGMLLYGSISTGYRAGGINIRGIDDTTLEPFDEETVITYEIGHKTDWGLAGSVPVRTNIAVFYQEYSDIQKTVGSDNPNPLAGFGTGTINAAEAVIQGVEFDVTWLATENLMLTLAYSYLDASYDDWLIEEAWSAELIDVSDADFSYVPEQTLTASARYTLPLDPSLGDMSIFTSVYWQDDMHTFSYDDQYLIDRAGAEGWSQNSLDAALASLEADSYAIWNIRFDWRNVMETSFDASIYVDNVTDEEYTVGGLNVIQSLGYAAETLGPPRVIGAQLRYTF